MVDQLWTWVAETGSEEPESGKIVKIPKAKLYDSFMAQANRAKKEAAQEKTNQEPDSAEIPRYEARSREAQATAEANRQMVLDNASGMEPWKAEKKRDDSVAEARRQLHARLREIDQQAAPKEELKTDKEETKGRSCAV
jgi:hypothetical protein